MRTILRVAVVACCLTIAAFAQQANPPAQRVQRTPSSTVPTRSTPSAEAAAPAQAQPPSQHPPEEQPGRPAPTAQQPGRQTEQPGGPGAAIPPMHFDMTEVPPVQTHHTIRVNGQELRYTATTGRLPIKDAEGKIEAEMFFVAYTLDGADPATRPLTFAYNGGPGSSSIWLHMGALGPKKIAMQPEGWLPQPPYRFVDNPNTPLDKTDLVLVDAVGTGYSRPADANAARNAWIRAVNALVAMAEMVGLAPEDDRLLFSALRAAEQTISNRNRNKTTPAPAPATDTTTATK